MASSYFALSVLLFICVHSEQRLKPRSLACKELGSRDMSDDRKAGFAFSFFFFPGFPNTESQAEESPASSPREGKFTLFSAFSSARARQNGNRRRSSGAPRPMTEDYHPQGPNQQPFPGFVERMDVGIGIMRVSGKCFFPLSLSLSLSFPPWV